VHNEILRVLIIDVQFEMCWPYRCMLLLWWIYWRWLFKGDINTTIRY